MHGKNTVIIRSIYLKLSCFQIKGIGDNKDILKNEKTCDTDVFLQLN